MFSPEAGVLELNNVIINNNNVTINKYIKNVIHGGGDIVTNKTYSLLDGNFHPEGTYRRSNQYNSTLFFHLLKMTTKSCEGTYLYLGCKSNHTSSPNYGHFLLDCIGKLALFEKQVILSQILIISICKAI